MIYNKTNLSLAQIEETPVIWTAINHQASLWIKVSEYPNFPDLVIVSKDDRLTHTIVIKAVAKADWFRLATEPEKSRPGPDVGLVGGA